MAPHFANVFLSCHWDLIQSYTVEVPPPPTVLTAKPQIIRACPLFTPTLLAVLLILHNALGGCVSYRWISDTDMSEHENYLYKLNCMLDK